MPRWRRRRYREESEMNITAFMNLMVILVPFLLITATFSQLSVLGIELPSSTIGEKRQKQSPALDLSIILRPESLQIRDGKTLIAILANNSNGYDLAALDRHLDALKRRFPMITRAQLLAEAQIPYEDIITLLDHLRQAVDKEGIAGKERFPLISLGNAPDSQESKRP